MAQKVSLRKRIKNGLGNSRLGIYSLHVLRKLREKWALRLNDYQFLRKRYKKNFKQDKLKHA